MPQRYIKIPEPVILKDPVTRKPLTKDDGQPEDPVTFEAIVNKLMHNPMWTETYPNIRAANAITDALSKANGVMVLAEDDWKKLEAAVQNPKQVVISQAGPATVIGFGFHPVIVPQIVSLLDAIVEATTNAPVEQKAP